LMTATPLVHVVEDDESVRTSLLRLIKAAGFEARGYGSADDFLANLPVQRAGCLLLDIHLPGASGLDLQDALPAHGISLPVVFITGQPDAHSRLRAIKAGAVDYLQKPADRATLLGAVERALQQDALQRAQSGRGIG
ncbi:MAG: response regulator, partial [Variovorax sp.]